MLYWRLYRNEIAKSFTQWRTYIGFGAITVGVILAVWGIHYGSDGIQQDLLRNIGDEFITTGNVANGMWASYLLMNTLYFHIPFLVTVVAGDIVAGEGTSGTFRIYLTRPVSRLQILFAKLLAAASYAAWLLLWLAIFSLALGNIWLGSGDVFILDDQGILILPWDMALGRFILAYAFSFIAMFSVTSLTFMFSVMVTNAVGPIIGAMAVIIVFGLLTLIPVDSLSWLQDHLFTTHFGIWQFAFQDPIPWNSVANSVLHLSTYSAIFVAVAFLVFRRKDILT